MRACTSCDDAIERRVCEIRLRAERKAGQLLTGMEKAKAAGSNQHKERSRDDTAPPTLAEIGVSKSQSSKWQQLAAVPEERFEAALASPEKPSTSGIIKAQRERPENFVASRDEVVQRPP